MGRIKYTIIDETTEEKLKRILELEVLEGGSSTQ